MTTSERPIEPSTESWSLDTFKQSPDQGTPPGGLIHAAEVGRVDPKDPSIILLPVPGPGQHPTPPPPASTAAQHDKN